VAEEEMMVGGTNFRDKTVTLEEKAPAP